MCGILLQYGSTNKPCDIYQSLKPIIKLRGQDFQEELSLNNALHYSSVLSLRRPFCKQPLIALNKLESALHHEDKPVVPSVEVKEDLAYTKGKFIIQFNGELYNPMPSNVNDLVYLNELLIENDYNITKTLSLLDGEFAYAFTNDDNIWFGKDYKGKRSLFYYHQSATSDETSKLIISSCPPMDHKSREKFQECKANTIYKYTKSTNQVEEVGIIKKTPEVTSRDIQFDVDELYLKLRGCVQKRIETIFPLFEQDGKFSILFSGGIDCTLIAALCGDILSQHHTPEDVYCIDLLNVGFYNPRANLTPSDTPDRKLAIKSTHELNEKYQPNIKFNLIEIDVPYEEYTEAKQYVMDMIYPHDTEMDLSIAIAFYFASKFGNKVLLSGLGADELFGGYTRHEMVYTDFSNYTKRKLKGKPHKGPTEFDHDLLKSNLRDELQMDIDRIWVRNLSRDDRVISQWSKEARYPFLDDGFINWVLTSIPLEYKLFIDRETGEVIRKKGLRELAKFMGLAWIENEPKRAIQFGSKSAKIDPGSGKRNGFDKVN